MCDSSLATPYVMDPLLETMGLRGAPVLCILGRHKIWGDCTGRVKLFVFLGSEASCLFDVFEKGNEFVFELGGGVFGGALYMCWCPVVMLGLCWCSLVDP